MKLLSMTPDKPKISTLIITLGSALALVITLCVGTATEVNAQSVHPETSLRIQAAPWDAKNAPSSKYITTVTETRTTTNLNLRESPSTSASSYGVMPKNTLVKLTGKKDGSWAQLTWKSRTGWASAKYLDTRTYKKDTSTRYMVGYTQIHETSAMNHIIGAVNFRSEVSLLEMSSNYAHIKTGYYHGWVNSNKLSTRRPAAQYRYVQSSGSTYSHWNPNSDKYVGRIHRGDKYEYRRWVGSSKRDEIKVNGKWVWTSTTNRQQPSTEYRYAQENGDVYNGPAKNNSSRVGSISKGTKVRWGAWNGANRRDEILLNGRWVWTGVTDRKNPTPPIKNIANYSRFTTKPFALYKDPGSGSKTVGTVKKGWKVSITHTAGTWKHINAGSVYGWVNDVDHFRIHGPFSIAVYGTLRTGQSAYNIMGGFQQKNMNQRIQKTSLYQLWNPNWTFLTNGSKTVVTEQFQYSDSRGPSMLKKLDVYEGQLKYQGKPMYTRQKVRMSDWSQSWTYKTTPFSEKVVKNSGRYISSGDFLKRS